MRRSSVQPQSYSCDVGAAERFWQYNQFGNTTNPKVGEKWRPFGDLLVRGSWGTGFRAPNFTESNSTQSRGYRPLIDPCRSDTPVALPGCPNVVVPVTTGAWVLSGGNPDLRSETADTLTVGAVYTPDFVSGLSLTVDFRSEEHTSELQS